MTDQATMHVDRDTGGWPTIHYDIGSHRKAHTFFRELDQLREQSPFYWNTFGPQGFWIITRYAEVREAYQNHELFTNDANDPLNPNPGYRFIPTLVNPPDHVAYRQVLNRWFSPAAVARIEPMARQVCAKNIEALSPLGSADIMAEFALRYPTEVFLTIMGLPAEDASIIFPLTERFFDAWAAEDKSDLPNISASIFEYFTEVLADRRANRRDPATDFITYLLDAEVFGRPLDEQELLDICFVMVIAGLDTTSAQTGYLFEHLARHPHDRQRLVENPELVPAAVEEALRVYSIIIGDGRKVSRDADFHGVPLKKGDMVWLSAVAANRDPRVYPDPTEFRLDRKNNLHFGFAAGPHRCLGAHLARLEMVVAVEEWHRRIPDYRVAAGHDELQERGGMLTLFSLPLEWDPPATARPTAGGTS